MPLGHTWVQSFYLFIFQNILYYWKLAFLHLHYSKSRWRCFRWHKSRQLFFFFFFFFFFFMPLDLGNCLPKDTILYICLKYFTKSFIFHEEAFFGKKFHETCPKKGMGKFLSCKLSSKDFLFSFWLKGDNITLTNQRVNDDFLLK